MAGLLAAFLPAPEKWPWWVVPVLLLAVLAFVILVVLEFSGRRSRRIFGRSDAAGIRRYMHDWITNGGRVAIWTRDLSWAQNPETRRVLKAKAQRHELVLCLPELNELADELATAGAEVCIYGSSVLESPSSRFTITFLGRDGSRVAVGRAEGDAHVIDEFGAGNHPAFHVAYDLITLVRAMQQRKECR